MPFLCSLCGLEIGKYRVDVHRIEDNEIVESREYCGRCIKKLLGGDWNDNVGTQCDVP